MTASLVALVIVGVFSVQAINIETNILPRQSDEVEDTFPFLVELGNEERYWNSTGVIIRDNIILTSANNAHWFSKNSKLRVYVRTDELIGNEPKRSVFHPKEVIIHEKWNNQTATFDNIALIILENKIPLGKYAAVAKIEADNNMQTDDYRDEKINIIHWGSYNKKLQKFPLLHSRATLISNEKCNAHCKPQIDDSLFCVRVSDNGGPLIVSRKGHPTVIGIYSYDSRFLCKNQFEGHAFTRIGRYNSWITSHFTD